MSLWDFYLRWRHSKGYGVHSPYAYRFITDVLKPGNYGYYAYHELERLNRNLKSGRASFFHESRFLIRLILFLKARRVIALGEQIPEARIVAKALKLVYYCCESSSNLTLKAGDFLIIPRGATVTREILDEAVEKNVALLAIKPSTELREMLTAPLEYGVLFEGENRILLIPRKETQYVSYSINL